MGDNDNDGENNNNNNDNINNINNNINKGNSVRLLNKRLLLSVTCLLLPEVIG